MNGSRNFYSGNMVLVKLLCFSCLFVLAKGAGQFTILQTPDSLVFTGDEELDLSNVKNVLSTTLGFTIPEAERWRGLVVKDPFRFAEAVGVVAVHGAVEIEDAPQMRRYSLHTDEPLEDTWSALEWRISERFPTVDNLTALRIPLDNPKLAEQYFGELNVREATGLEHLKTSNPQDKAFLDQIMLMDAITSKMSALGIQSDGVPDLYWFEVPGLHALLDSYSEDSRPVVEAKRLLSSSTLLLSDVLTTLYDDKIVFATLTSDVAHTRRFRRQADKYPDEGDGEFAIIFNIILWFSIALFFAALAVSIGIADMDPGRDSIIYRMTSNRMKKEN